jgi:serine/threonine kinase 38
MKDQSSKAAHRRIDLNISAKTKEKAEIVKNYIEGKYARKKNEEKERKEGWDLLKAKMEMLNLTPHEKELIKQDVLHKEAELNRKARKRITIFEYEPLDIIGRGAFGEVRICRNKESGEVVAIKKMKKKEMLIKNQITHVRAEKDILSNANNEWIVDLKCSFQDLNNLYLVMEYLPGGDLMNLLIKKDILSEDESRFYMGEMVLAIECVHKLNYIHRDLKPDNVLLDADGHIKLTDFGLSKHAEIRSNKESISSEKYEIKRSSNFNALKMMLNKKLGYKRDRQLAFSTVGTPDYIAPEVFGPKGYDELVDWWSAGVIMFEMLVGYPPFFSDDSSITCQKILHWKKTLAIPAEAKLSAEAIDLIEKLITDPDKRYGRNGAEEIKAHPFFDGFDWDGVRKSKAPFIPDVCDPTSAEHFDKFDEEEPFLPDKQEFSKSNKIKRQKKDPYFINFTYKGDVENEKSKYVSALKELEGLNEQDTETTPQEPVKKQKYTSSKAYSSKYMKESSHDPK